MEEGLELGWWNLIFERHNVVFYMLLLSCENGIIEWLYK